MTSVFKEASRGYFLTLTSCVAKTQSPLSGNTFFPFLSGVVAEERRAPGKIILYVTDFQDQERGWPEMVLRQLLKQNILISPLLTPHSRLKVCFRSCFRGGPNIKPLFLTKDTYRPPATVELWEMVLPLGCHTATPRPEETQILLGGGGQVCLHNFLHY